jgi:hypothetical protein
MVANPDQQSRGDERHGEEEQCAQIVSSLWAHEHFAVDAVGLAHAVEHSQQCGRPHVVFAAGRNGALLQTVGLAQALSRDRIM